MRTPIPTICDPYWEEANWLPPWYILERWCQRDEACMQAKLQALLSACERGDIQYRRSDGKTYADPAHELFRRGKLLIQRQSFNRWCTALEGKTPLSGGTPSTLVPAVPVWAQHHQPSTPVATIQPVTLKPAASPVMVTVMADAPVSADENEADTPDAANEDQPEEELRKRAVTADEIIKAFRVKTLSKQNKDWWNERFTNATSRYPSILCARVQMGKASQGKLRFPSWWSPLLIASWLISSKHLSRDQAVRMLEHSFPDFAINAHLL